MMSKPIVGKCPLNELPCGYQMPWSLLPHVNDTLNWTKLDQTWELSSKHCKILCIEDSHITNKNHAFYLKYYQQNVSFKSIGIQSIIVNTDAHLFGWHFTAVAGRDEASVAVSPGVRALQTQSTGSRKEKATFYSFSSVFANLCFVGEAT